MQWAGQTPEQEARSPEVRQLIQDLGTMRRISIAIIIIIDWMLTRRLLACQTFNGRSTTSNERPAGPRRPSSS